MYVLTPSDHTRHQFPDGSEMCSVSNVVQCKWDTTYTNDGWWLGIYNDRLNPLPGKNVYRTQIEAKDETTGKVLGRSFYKEFAVIGTLNRVPVLVESYYSHPVLAKVIEKGSILFERFKNLQGIEAAKMIRPLAEQGNPEAQYLAAKCFYEGIGVKKDNAKALYYARLATETSDETRRNLSIAERMSLLDANIIASKICFEGIGVEKNIEMAFNYACQLKQYSYIGESLYDELLEYYKPKDYELYLRLASNNTGYGKMSDAECERCAEASASPDYLLDMRRQCSNDVIYGYLTGKGCEKNVEKALSYCSNDNKEMKAEIVDYLISDTANIEHLKTAIYQIDTYHLSNTNYAKDANIAGAYWNNKYNNAKLLVWETSPTADLDKNFNDGILSMKLQKIESSGMEVQHQEFTKWLRHAESGSVSAMYIVSVMYEKGFGISSDRNKAKEWAKKASDISRSEYNIPRFLYYRCNNQFKNLDKLYLGKITDDGIVVYCEDLSGPTVVKGGLYFLFYSPELRTMTYNDVKKLIKEKMYFAETSAYAIDESRIRLYYVGLQEKGKPFKEGKYWSISTEGVISLVTLDGEGQIIDTRPGDKLSKQEKNESYYFIEVSSKFQHHE